jgi:hypothetical protein
MKQKIINVLVLLIAQLPASQSAQAFPDRLVKLVVPRLQAVRRISWHGSCRTRWALLLDSR